MNDDELRILYQEAIARRRAPDHAACPAPEALLALLERESGEAERLAVLDHVMACETCRREFVLLRAIRGAASPAVRARRSWAGSLPRMPLAVAAALMILIGGAAVVRELRLERATPDIMRGDADAIALVAPAGVVEGTTSLDLIWRGVPGAHGYEVEILDAAGTPVFSATTPDTLVRVPAPALRPREEYRWWVQAHMADGAQRRSGLAAFHLRAP